MTSIRNFTCFLVTLPVLAYAGLLLIDEQQFATAARAGAT